jgi:hypothetical protein
MYPCSSLLTAERWLTPGWDPTRINVKKWFCGTCCPAANGPCYEHRQACGPLNFRSRPFSSDGAALLTTDPSLQNLRLWDVATGRHLLDLPAEVGFVHFSPDGQWLAGIPGRFLPGTAGDVRVFHRSDRLLPPPMIRGRP